MLKVISRVIIFVIILMLAQRCTEPYSAGTQNFDDLLVVEASITDELKKQEIKLTRTYKFEEIRPEVVTDAIVTVSDNQGNSFDFHFQDEDSLYVSDQEFQAIPENEYTLKLEVDGKTIVSESEILPTANQVSLTYEKTEVDGESGVQIAANSYDPSNSSHYYQYEYEETYKIVVPLASILEAHLIPSTSVFYPYLVELGHREEETRVCYKTKYSHEIILSTTKNLSEDRVVNFPVTFIPQSSDKLIYKYSILVKQYTESQAAYTFHKLLKEVSSTSGSILSPNQPGYVQGNLSVSGNKDQKIIGYFQVASVSSDRIFLEYREIFPGELLPTLEMNCPVQFLDPTHPYTTGSISSDYKTIVNNILTGEFLLYRIRESDGFFMMVPAACTDCTTHASNVVPDFWQ